jgi:dienelactone hydrolase
MLLSFHFATPPCLAESSTATAWSKIAPFFTPPPQYADDCGTYSSPLKFYNGAPVRTPAEWPARRAEILAKWHGLMGAWPPLLEKPQIKFLEKTRRDNVTQHKVEVEIAPDHRTIAGYLLVPDGSGPFPAVVTVFYEPETAIGLGKEQRGFALDLARRGFVALSVGHQASIYYPSEAAAELQPLSMNAYAAANCFNALAHLTQRPDREGGLLVDPDRIGIVGHSYGGKWAMFASCLYDKFACAAWSDGGIVFDEARPNVNYWEPWYLGYDRTVKRKVWSAVTPDNPRTGAYKKMIEEGRDLHELHALMAPRPFLVSGGSEDRPERWKALNHAVAVNRLLGYTNRVAMTNREGHSPTPESNEQIYAFFEHFLKR